MKSSQLVAAAVVLAMSVGCRESSQSVSGEPGSPLPGLTEAESAAFYAGSALFNKVYTVEEGVGPLFNENQCSACHTDPAPGGTTGFEFVFKASRFTEEGVCDPLSSDGGENVRKRATPLLQAHGVMRAEVPSAATANGRLTTPFLFGLGLVESISVSTILEREDPNDDDGDGISGRAGRTPDGRLARFGRKAEVATIEEFTQSALLHEMGLTTPLKPKEQTANGVPFPEGTDPAPDPEIQQNTVDALTAFVRFLAPPTPAVSNSEQHADTLRTGEELFAQIGCAECHIPSMQTGANDIAALDRKIINLYSDLLLHDMGEDLADVCGYNAAPSELRTEMLMGLGHRSLFLHDGRASTVEEAILLHGGEGQRARDAFANLTWLRQRYIIWFLESL